MRILEGEDWQGALGEGEAVRALDARVDRLAAKSQELAQLFYRYGEERRSRKLARVIAEMRKDAPVTRSEQLVQAIDRALVRARTTAVDYTSDGGARVTVMLDLRDLWDALQTAP